LGQLLGRIVLYGALALALGIVVVSACGPQPESQPSPPVKASASASRTASAAPVPSATTTATARPSLPPTAIPSVSASPGTSPAAACQRQAGGDTNNQAQLVAVRIAHQPGFDRLVFEFGQSSAPGPFGLPAYTIESTISLTGPSGQPVAIIGNALFGIRFQNTSTQTPTGGTSYTGSTDLRPTTPLIKNVKLAEDFERVMVWGTGLDRLVCPSVLTLSSPTRVVLDFPTPP
jgi:hypothetical protein